MRASLVDWINAGNDISTWGESVGFVLPTGTKPARKNVLPQLHEFNAGGEWMVLRRPLLTVEAVECNAELVHRLHSAPRQKFQYGRLTHEGRITSVDEVRFMLLDWAVDPVSPSWRHEYIIEMLHRLRKNARALILFIGYPVMVS
jgi:hypothetical protein